MLEHIMGYFGTYTPAADGAHRNIPVRVSDHTWFRSHRYLLRTRDCRSQRPAQKICDTGSGYLRYHLFCCCIYHQGFRNHRFFL